MKKFFFLTCMMLSGVMAFAQTTKKVAILETVDREGKVSYANKLILRSNLAKAITNTPGYEAYDRTDMDAILSEQNFQRTGLVSDAQIKRLGEMTGADYVLVAEAAVIDAETMYVAAKLLDIETARTEMTDNQMMVATPQEIQRGCQLLAANLMKPIDAKRKALKNAAKEIEYAEQDAKLSNMRGQIVKISDHEYRIGNTKMDKEAYERFIYGNCPEAWKKYKGGKIAVIIGWAFFGIGAVATTVGGVCFADSDRNDELAWENREDNNMYEYYRSLERSDEEWGINLICEGPILVCAGMITFSCGYVAKGNAYKVYNQQCARQQLSFNLTAGQNGLGIAMNF